VNELVTRMGRVRKLYPAAFTTNDSDVNFIHLNVLDEVLLSCEKVYSILVEDNNLNITKTRNIGISLMITVLIIGCALFGFFVFRLRASFKFRDDLLNIYLRLDENYINHHLSKVRILINALTLSNIRLNDFVTRDFDIHTEPRTKTKKDFEAEASQGMNMRKKKASFKKNNEIIARILIMKVIGLLMLVIPFAQILISMESNSTEIKSKINTIIEVNNAVYEIVLIYTSLYDYLFTKGEMTLRTRPINTEWEEVYANRLRTADFLSSLLIKTQKDTTINPVITEYISELINGNLCEVLPPKVGQQLCTIVQTGFLTKGIQSISLKTLDTLRAVKDQFDRSSKTTADMKSALGLRDFIGVELSVWQWQYEAYLEIGRVYGTLTTTSIDDTASLLKHVWIFYGFWYL